MTNRLPFSGSKWSRITLLLAVFTHFLLLNAAARSGPSATDHDSLQAALDAHPGQMIHVPSGEYRISQKLRLRLEGSGLYGSGTVIQENPQQPIIEIENGDNIQIRGLTLTRPEGKQETRAEGILAIKCRDLVLENLRIIDNRTRASAIAIRECQDARVSHCLIRNYMQVTVDDRTGSADWGYAFNCTDGTGIAVTYSTGTLLEGNHVVEENFVPTPETKAKYKLGDWIKKNPVKGNFIHPKTWEAEYTDNWQQGSGIIVTSPEVSDRTRILGNHIENAAQGIDLHSDHVIVANNIVANSFMGMKAMHGSRNVLITGNQFTRNSLWAIGLMPGAAARADNADGGSVIANNIISDFGHGDANWIWGNERSPIKFDTGQQDDDPPLADVIIQGNVIQTIGEPRYKYAVIIPGGPKGPQGLHFTGNLFHPGTAGIANRELAQ